MLVKLLEKWTNGDVEYAEGVTLDMDNKSDADELIKSGIAKPVKRPVKQVDMDEIDNASIDAMSKLLDAKLADLKNSNPVLPEKKVGQVVHDNSLDNKEYFKTGGWGNVGDFAQDVARAEKRVFSKRLTEWTEKTTGIMSASDDTEGGYLIPDQFNASLLSTMIEDTIVRQRAQFIPMQTNSIIYPCVYATSHASSLFGGIVIYRTDEGSQKTVSKPQFGQVQLTLHNLTGLIYVTNQLLEDSPISIEPLITDMFARAIAWQEDDDFINGTGVAQALGVLKANCLIAQAAETGQDADTVLYENVIKMWARLHPRSRKNAIWLVSTDVLPQLFQMTLAVDTGGTAVYLPPGGASATPYGNLLGRPVIEDRKSVV